MTILFIIFNINIPYDSIVVLLKKAESSNIFSAIQKLYLGLNLQICSHTNPVSVKLTQPYKTSNI